MTAERQGGRTAGREDGRAAGGRIVAGVDAGGSRTRAVIATPDLTILGRAEGPGAALTDHRPGEAAAIIGDVLKRATRAAGTTSVSALVAGVAGAGDESRRAALDSALAGVADRVRVVTDAEIALADAVPQGPGIVVIAGTGSIAWARGPNDESWRAGGLGPATGDGGGGYWLARSAEQRGILEPAPGRPRAETAARAADVLGKAAAGDPTADALLDEAADALLALVRELRNRFPPDRSIPVGLAGGLLQPGSALADHTRARLAALDGIEVLETAVDPVRGAARLAVTSER